MVVEVAVAVEVEEGELLLSVLAFRSSFLSPGSASLADKKLKRGVQSGNNGTYSFIDLLSLLLRQPIQRIRILRRTMRLRRGILSNSLLLLLLSTFRGTEIRRRRGAQTTMSRERGCTEGHRICVGGAFWEFGARVGARRERLAGGHSGYLLVKDSSMGGVILSIAVWVGEWARGPIVQWRR